MPEHEEPSQATARAPRAARHSKGRIPVVARDLVYEDQARMLSISKHYR